MHWIPTGNADTLQGRSSGKIDSWRHHRYSPDEILQTNSSPQSEPVVLVSFLSARKDHDVTPDEVRLQNSLSTKFAIPKWLWRAEEQDANGYFYGSSLPSLIEGSHRHVSVFRFMIKYVTGQIEDPDGGLPAISYAWHILTFVVYSESGQKAALLCFNIPGSLARDMEGSLRQRSARKLTAHPFMLHALILEHVVEMYDHAIWQFRDFVRLTEKHRPTIDNPQPDYAAMHELARHVMHSSEVLSTALNVVDNLLEELDRFERRLPGSSGEHDPGPDARHKRSMLQFMQNRSEALEGRLKNEMALAFHITAQHSSEASTQIAQAAKVDSGATKTISVLGLLFLPGTFISAIFSMSFFNFTPATDTSPAYWRVSDKFWIYWVVTIPVTALTVMLWSWWQRQYVSRDATVGSRNARTDPLLRSALID